MFGIKISMRSVDKIVRIIAGAAALWLGYYYQSYWGLVGLLPLLTISIRSKLESRI